MYIYFYLFVIGFKKMAPTYAYYTMPRDTIY